MKRIRWDWRLLKLVVTSRGYLLKEVAGQLPVEKFPNRKGLAEKTLHGNVKKGKKAPRKIAEHLMTEEGMPTRPGYERTAKVVRLGLAVLSGLPSPTIARKLDALLAEVAAIRTVLKVAAHATGTALGILLLVGLMSAGQRSGMSNGATTNATQPPPVGAAAKGAAGATGIGVYLRALLGGVFDLGKKAEENWIPKTPYPGQKLEKDCKASMGEEAINGGCWVALKKAPPCGTDLFRHGDTCYRPVTADPTKPVGLVRTAPVPQ
jgi:hypothetical protein